MKLGTLTITGQYPATIDGLFIGYNKRTARFKITTDGFERKGKLYKTFDSGYLIESLGIVEAKQSIKYSVVK